MDFHLATPDGDVYLFSEEGGRIFTKPAAAVSQADGVDPLEEGRSVQMAVVVDGLP
jgi:hypothetical protein